MARSGRRAVLAFCYLLVPALAAIAAPEPLATALHEALQLLPLIGVDADIVATALRGMEQGWHRSPAIAVGIGSALAVPLLACAMPILRGILGGGDDRALTPHFSDSLRSPMARAWVELDGAHGRRVDLAREIVRIGHGSDSDLRLPGGGAETVDVLIRRTPESEFIVIDVSGGAGPGIAVNGQRRTSERLRDGDHIAFGSCSMTFRTAPAWAPSGTAVHRADLAPGNASPAT